MLKRYSVSIAMSFAPVLVVGLGCTTPQLSVQIASGPQAFSFDSASLGIPAALRSSDGTLARVPCQGACPTSDPLTLQCASNVCDPAPYTLQMPVGNVVDVSRLLQGVGRSLSDVAQLEVASTDLRVDSNSLNIAIPASDILIGPESAQNADDPSVRPFGSLSPIEAGATGPHSLLVGAEGNAALNTLGRMGRIRFFLRTSLDLNPGDPVPTGAMAGNVNVTIRVRTNFAI